MKILNIVSILALLIFANCVTRQELLTAPEKLPTTGKQVSHPVTVTMKYSANNDHWTKDKIHPMTPKVTRLLKSNGGFDHVIVWSHPLPYRQYHLEVLVTQNDEIGIFTWISIFTLFILPSSMDSLLQFDINVYRGKKTIKTYTYKEKMNTIMWLFAIPALATKYSAGKQNDLLYTDLGKRIVADLGRDKIIPPLRTNKSRSPVVVFSAAITRVSRSNSELRLYHPGAARLFQPGQILNIRRRNSSKIIGKAQVKFISYTYATAKVIEGNINTINIRDTVARMR